MTWIQRLESSTNYTVVPYVVDSTYNRLKIFEKRWGRCVRIAREVTACHSSIP